MIEMAFGAHRSSAIAPWQSRAMSPTVVCPSCGYRVPIPKGYDRPRIRCPECGDYGDVPANDGMPICAECGERMSVKRGRTPYCERCHATRITSSFHPWGLSATPLPPAATAIEPPVPVTDEDDDSPYAIPDDPEPKEPCPDCRKSVPRGARVCNHCGFDRQTGTRVQRVYEKVDRQWDAGLAFRWRFGAFAAVQGLALIAIVVVALADGNILDVVIGWAIGALLLAFSLGTYPRVNLTRSKRGQVRLTKAFRFCFIPMPASQIRWREYEGVVTGQSHDTDMWDWLVLVFLFPWGVVPAILWWLFVIEPDQFHVALSKDHGNPALLLYRGQSEAKAKEIAAAIRGVTGLP
jgi:hypothetical protein